MQPTFVSGHDDFAHYRLVKYCRRLHNVAHACPTLQIGTLHYYRTLDPKSPLADRTEGARVTRLGPGGPVYMNARRSYRAFGPGIQLNGWVAVLPGGQIRVEDSIDNCLLYCCSWFPRSIQPRMENGQYLGGYDSMYEIKSAPAFADALAAPLLLASKKVLVSPPSSLEGMTMTCRFGPVLYVPDKIDNVSVDRMLELSPWESRLFWAVALKTNQYQLQREFRFVWEFFDTGHRRLQVRKEPVILELGGGLRGVCGKL